LAVSLVDFRAGVEAGAGAAVEPGVGLAIPCVGLEAGARLKAEVE